MCNACNTYVAHVVYAYTNTTPVMWWYNGHLIPAPYVVHNRVHNRYPRGYLLSGQHDVILLPLSNTTPRCATCGATYGTTSGTTNGPLAEWYVHNILLV